MGKQGFEEFRQTLINQNVFKKIKKESVLDCKNILKILYETKNKMRAKEIQESIQRDIKITSLNARLKLLEMRGLLKVSGRKRIYIKDLLSDKAYFGPGIGEIIDLFMKNLLRDGATRNRVKQVIITTLSPYEFSHKGQITKIILLIEKISESDDLDSLIDTMKLCLGDDLFNFYDDAVSEVIEKKLYNEEKGYGKLQWQSMANKYMLNITF